MPEKDEGRELILYSYQLYKFSILSFIICQFEIRPFPSLTIYFSNIALISLRLILLVGVRGKSFLVVIIDVGRLKLESC